MQASTVEKLNRIQSLFDEGKSHAEIAKEVGYTKIESFYRYIYKYDNYLKYKKLFNKKGLTEVQKNTQVEEKNITPKIGEENAEVDKCSGLKQGEKESFSKAETIISLIDRGIDVREVAKKKRFKDVQDMANYMKSKSYKWSSLKKNYEREILEKQVSPDVSNYEAECVDDECNCNCYKRFGDILRMLETNKNKLNELLNEDNQGVMKRYRIHGTTKTKSININSSLEQLINGFCDEMNITQKEAFEIAMIDFLKKYGYMDEVNVLLKT
jgi:hypothetical protein